MGLRALGLRVGSKGIGIKGFYREQTFPQSLLSTSKIVVGFTLLG